VRILILGGTGMLGHKLHQVLSQSNDVWVTARRQYAEVERFHLFPPERFLGGLDVEDDSHLDAALEISQPEVAINCVGVVKQVTAAQDPIRSIAINALLPHRFHKLCAARGVRLLHFSTDCVYSGRKGAYTEDDSPDPYDLYGRSKLLGEVAGPHALTIRTSIIGRELFTCHGLVEWFLAHPGPEVNGFTRAVFSGLPTVSLASAVRDILLPRDDLAGVWHLSAEPITKYRLLVLLAEGFGRDVHVVPVDEPAIDRSLDSSRLRIATEITSPGWPDLVSALVSDSAPYYGWRDDVKSSRASAPSQPN
jgi:dTDP-4-dehydrorhamnose reductase